MKITGFNPAIVTNNADEAVKLFEALGFEQRHNPSLVSASGEEQPVHRMTDANGFHVDIIDAGPELPKDASYIRMNVDDFDEAVRILKEHGFKPLNGDVHESKSALGCEMESPSGYRIVVVKHIKSEDK